MTVRVLVSALAAALLCAGLATAATPSDGKVSSASPRVEWTGESNGYLYYNYQRVSRTGGQQPRCDAPACDEFTLEVVDSADLTISATYETTVFLDFDIVFPDGSSVWIDGSDENNTTTTKIKKAKPGTYKIRVTTNGTASQDGAFTAFAQLATAAAPVVAAAPEVPAAPAPAPVAPQLSIATRSASLKKLKKRALVVSLSSTAPVSGVKVFLRKGKKIVAKGALASLDGAGKVTLRLPKSVKPGRYVLAAATSGTAASAPLTIKR